MVLDGLSGLYGIKYDSATACGLRLYLCSYKLDGSATGLVLPRTDDDSEWLTSPKHRGIFYEYVVGEGAFFLVKGVKACINSPR